MALQKTFITKPQHITHEWWVVDAKGQTLGRLATRIATLLRGKHKPYFVPNLDCGDFVVVINCELIAVTGQKLTDKIYYRHTNYPGGIRATRLKDQLERFPDRVIMAAVKGMLPKSAIGHQAIKKLKIYAGSEHPHAAQKPKVLEL